MSIIDPVLSAIDRTHLLEASVVMEPQELRTGKVGVGRFSVFPWEGRS